MELTPQHRTPVNEKNNRILFSWSTLIAMSYIVFLAVGSASSIIRIACDDAVNDLCNTKQIDVRTGVMTFIEPNTFVYR